MDMKKRTGLAITALALLAMLLVFISSVKRQQMRDAQETSSRRALFVEIENSLYEYSATHGKYPSSLSQLLIRSFPDGSSSATLKHFNYSSNGKTYRLSVPSADRNELFVSETGKFSRQPI